MPILLNEVEELAGLAWRHLWQVTALILVVGGVTKWLCPNRPHLAFGLWLLVFLKCLIPPLWNSPWSPFCWQEQIGPREQIDRREQAVAQGGRKADNRAFDSRSGDQAEASADQGSRRKTREERGETGMSMGIVRVGGMSTAHGADPTPHSGRRAIGALLGAVWLVGAVSFVLLAVVHTWRFRRRLRRVASPAATNWPALQDRVEQLVKRIGVRGRLRVLIASPAWGPMVFGVFRPTIVLPEALLARLLAENDNDHRRAMAALEPILAHEMLHIRRRDTLSGFLQLAAVAMWWFHPLVWWAQRQANRACEQCCDEEAIAALNYRQSDYVRCLVKLLELRHDLGWPPALAGARAAKVTLKRLERLMRSTHRFSTRTPNWCWGVLLLFGFLALPGAAPVNGDDVQTFRAAADQAFAGKQWKEAAANYRRLVKVNPQDARSWFRLGYALHADKQWKKALEIHRQAATFAQIRPVAKYNAACALALLGKKKEALQTLKEAIADGFRSARPLEKDSDFASLLELEEFKKLAERAKPPSQQDVYRQFDFWVGKWNVFNPQGVKVGTNTITKAERGFLITEKWTNSQGDTGTSINYYDPSDEKWKQTWISAGQIVRYAGGFEDGKMKMLGETVLPNGRKGLRRMTLTPLFGGRVRQFIEKSADEGKTWQKYFDGVYIPQTEEEEG